MKLGLKVISETPETALVGGYGFIWGGCDLIGERFTKKTDFWTDRITETPVVLYDHGQDGKVKKLDVGRVASYKDDDIGRWVEMQIDKAKQYATQVLALVEKKRLGLSSGAVSHLVEIAKDGEIKSWPWVELSFTPTPCEPRTMPSLHQLDEVPGMKGIQTVAVKSAALVAQYSQLPNAAFAFVDADRGRFLPYRTAKGKFDRPAAKAALLALPAARMTDTEKDAARIKIEAAAAKAGIKIVRSARKTLTEGSDTGGGYLVSDDQFTGKPKKKKGPVSKKPVNGGDGTSAYGTINSKGYYMAALEGSNEDTSDDLRRLINAAMQGDAQFGSYPYASVIATFSNYCIVQVSDSDDGSYWRFNYSMGSDGEPVLSGAPQKMEPGFSPSTRSVLAPLRLQAADVAIRAAALVKRTKDLHQRRAKQHRTFSADNRKALAKAASQAGSACKRMRRMLATSKARTRKGPDVSKAEALAEAARTKAKAIQTALALGQTA